MNLYVDASAMVKRYMREEGSVTAAGWWRQARAVASTELCFVEVHAALAQAARLGMVDDEPARRQAERWSLEWPDVFRIAVAGPVIRVAADLTWRRGLRGYDAVHLASALGWRSGLGETVWMATFDRRLWDAAVAEGLGVLPEVRP